MRRGYYLQFSRSGNLLQKADEQMQPRRMQVIVNFFENESCSCFGCEHCHN